MASAAPWAAWLQQAVSLGLAPDRFWRLSVREWRALTPQSARLSREDFAALAARFPDG